MEIDKASKRPAPGVSKLIEISAKLLSGELMLSEKKGKSKIWKVYSKIVNREGVETKGIVRCRNCKKFFKYNNQSSSNLVKHRCYILKTACASSSKPEVDKVTKYTKINEAITKISTISAKISSGEFMLREGKGRSKVWQVFCRIVDSEGVEMKGIVSCKECKKLFKYNHSTSNLVKHKCYVLNSSAMFQIKIDVNEGTKNSVAKLFTKWIIKNCRPCDLVRDDGLQAVLQEFAIIGAKYGANIDVAKALPQPTTISRSVGELYEQCFRSTKEEINLIKENGFGLTTGIWTDDYLKISYIAVTIHFVKNAALSVRLLGMKSMAGERCTSENIYKTAQKLLLKIGCDFSHKSTIVTESGRDMLKAFSNMQHLACISHLLRNTLQKSIEEVTEVVELTNCCAELVEYFKQTDPYANLSISLKSYCPTRWNTVHNMLELIENNWDEINRILQSNCQLHRIKPININLLKAVTNVLEPFIEALTALEAENYATIHLVLVYLHQLKNTCDKKACGLQAIHSLKEKLRFYLETFVIKNITTIHKIALFLYPPTNKLLQCTDAEKQHIENECVRIMKNFQNEIASTQEVASTASSTSVPKYKQLFSDFVEPERVCDTNDNISQELLFYKNTKVAYSTDFNVFAWWELQKHNFPLLYKLSCMVLATPASSVSSERIFSIAGNLLTENSSLLGLNESVVNQIMFMHFNVGNGEL